MTSAPPPDPAGMMNSTGLSGTQALAVPMEVNTNAKEHATTRPIFRPENLFPMDEPSQAFFFDARFNNPAQPPPPFLWIVPGSYFF
jgi:hypothetical protein